MEWFLPPVVRKTGVIPLALSRKGRGTRTAFLLPLREKDRMRGSIVLGAEIRSSQFGAAYSLRVSTLSASIVYPVSASPVYWDATFSVPVT